MKIESKSIFILLSCLSLLAIIIYVSVSVAQDSQNSYLPMIFNVATATPTRPSATPDPHATPTVTPSQATPTPTSTIPPPPIGNVVITYINYAGSGNSEPDEYVEILNNSFLSIQLENWTLRDEANHVFTFPRVLIQPDHVCRIYTNQIHPEWCGFNYGSTSPIWDNSGDCAYLRDSDFNLIDDYCYQP